MANQIQIKDFLISQADSSFKKDNYNAVKSESKFQLILELVFIRSSYYIQLV